MPKKGHMYEPSARPSGMILPGLLIVAGFSLALFLNLPGQLSYDSVLQLLEGRTGIYNTWHPPVMAWLLGIGDALVSGAALYVTFQSVLSFGTFLSLLAFRGPKPGWSALCFALALILLPQLLLYQGIVWKDVLFADCGVAGFVCLAHVARVWPSSPWRTAWGALALALLCVAALTRQNGLLLLPPAAAACGWIVMRRTRSVRTGIISGSAALATAGFLVTLATSAVNLRSNGDSGPSEQVKLLELYDLSGAVAAEPGFPLSHLARSEPALERLIRSEGAHLYTPARVDPIASSSALQTELRNANVDALGADWITLFTAHPLTYLTIRAQVFWWVLATPDIFQCRPLFVGVEGPPDALKVLGLSARRTAADNRLQTYGLYLLNTPVFSHLAFAGMGLIAMALLLRRRRAEDIALAAMLVAVCAFAASFFVISIACDYRYLYFLDLSALVALFYLALDIRSALKGSP